MEVVLLWLLTFAFSKKVSKSPCASQQPPKEMINSHTAKKKVSWCKETHRQRASIPVSSQFPLEPLLAAAGSKSWSLGRKLKERKHTSSEDGSSQFYTKRTQHSSSKVLPRLGEDLSVFPNGLCAGSLILSMVRKRWGSL